MASHVPGKIVELVLTIKRENMHWSQKRISQELRRMGVQVSAPTVQKILEEHGVGPRTRGSARQFAGQVERQSGSSRRRGRWTEMSRRPVAAGAVMAPVVVRGRSGRHPVVMVQPAEHWHRDDLVRLRAELPRCRNRDALTEALVGARRT